MTRALVFAVVSTLAVWGGAGAAFAGIATGSAFTVKVQVVAGCSIVSPPGYTFTTTAGTSAAPAAVRQAMSVTCSAGTPYQIAFVSANDKDATGVTKIMKGTKSGNADTIAYNLRAAGVNIGKQDGVNTISATGTGAAQARNIRAVITTWIGSTGGRLTPDTYTDLVTARVDY